MPAPVRLEEDTARHEEMGTEGGIANRPAGNSASRRRPVRISVCSSAALFARAIPHRIRQPRKAPTRQPRRRVQGSRLTASGPGQPSRHRKGNSMHRDPVHRTHRRRLAGWLRSPGGACSALESRCRQAGESNGPFKNFRRQRPSRQPRTRGRALHRQAHRRYLRQRRRNEPAGPLQRLADERGTAGPREAGTGSAAHWRRPSLTLQTPIRFNAEIDHLKETMRAWAPT